MIRIPIIWDFDKTLTEDQSLYPLFESRWESIRPILREAGLQGDELWEYFARCEQTGMDSGLAYMQTMIADARDGNALDGLTRDELIQIGRRVTPAPQLAEGLHTLKDKLSSDIQLDHYIISAGLIPIIEGFIAENKLDEFFPADRIRAGDFIYNSNGIPIQVKSLIQAYDKTKHLIEIAKGDPRKLDIRMHDDEYLYPYQDLIVWGDGQTDASIMAYTLKKGGTPIATYTDGSRSAFKNTREALDDFCRMILPQNFDPSKPTYSLFKEEIERKAAIREKFPYTSLHDFSKGRFGQYPEIEEAIKTRLAESTPGKAYFEKITVMPNGLVSKTQQTLSRHTPN